MAWAKELEAVGLKGAQVVGVGAATLAVIAGAVVAGPLAGWIVRRHRLHAREVSGADVASADPPTMRRPAEPEQNHIETLLGSVLVVAICVFLGEMLNGLAKNSGLLLPGFLCAMLAGVVITNLADLFKLRLAFAPIETGGAVALQLFLATAP